MKILNKTEAPLLSRTVYNILIEHINKPTPNKIEIRKMISEELGIKEELIVIKNIETKFGQGKAKIVAYSYKTAKDLNSIETKAKKAKKSEEK